MILLCIAVLAIASCDGRFCNNLLQGMSRLRNGVDVTKLDLLPLDVVKDNGFRLPIIDFTCNNGKSREINGKRYDVPDQVISINSLPNGWVDADVSIYKSSSDLTKSMSLNAEVSTVGGLFSASASYEAMQHSITNTSKYIEDVKAFVSANQINMIPFWGASLSKTASLFVSKYLNKSVNENPTAYKTFIQYFGTHYMENGKYGGLIRMLLETDKSYYKSHSTSQVKAEAKGTFFNFIKAGGGGGRETVEIDTRFFSSTSTKIRYYGGDTNLLGKDNGIPSWQPTVAENPWLFSGKLVPIHNFITDGNIQASMIRAVEAYIDHAYLRQLQKLVYSFKAKSFLQTELDVFKQKIEAFSKMNLPSHSAVHKLGRKIKESLTLPSWYSERVKLCYRWYPDGDGGQCGGGAQRLLCAKPGSLTPVYRDDSDRRDGGCQMSWGIMSEGSVPTWFRNVQVCYKWAPDGDGQCSGEARELCAKAGAYTPYYRDDTDARAGGCRMQWKLVVPNQAPLWMRNARLCYQWYPDGDGGQCGGGVGRSLCANANQYTVAYRDDTDRRDGGCRMSWGIVL